MLVYACHFKKNCLLIQRNLTQEMNFMTTVCVNCLLQISANDRMQISTYFSCCWHMIFIVFLYACHFKKKIIVYLFNHTCTYLMQEMNLMTTVSFNCLLEFRVNIQCRLALITHGVDQWFSQCFFILLSLQHGINCLPIQPYMNFFNARN